MEKTTIKWLIDNLPSEVVENNKILFEGALNVEKSALSYFWSKAQLEQQRKNHLMLSEEFEEFYNKFNKED
jgi:hypothetical protein